jgi:hypothetical protein
VGSTRQQPREQRAQLGRAGPEAELGQEVGRRGGASGALGQELRGLLRT